MNLAKTRVQREELKLSGKARKSKNRKKNRERKGRWRRKRVEIGRRNENHSEGKRGEGCKHNEPQLYVPGPYLEASACIVGTQVGLAQKSRTKNFLEE